MISWIEVLVGCREGESEAVQAWLNTFARLALDDAIARETVRQRQQYGLKVTDAIILATARCGGLTLATRNSRDFPLTLGGVVYPYRI
ncbi:PIN domain-containing protein [Synechococcus sp. BA-132 BA5]|uniref:PIN domain-containing protein n=1 Tax=Synechococcus sp. BA-132 BA5 TaxID=3110252 RepID=UPI002B1F986E|nr:PIN domain-containing protein [Synechococcus sp. BA-132 BA5]MEA5416007.1 PIN domain-containing protein [Synechococcus sp. BA-132 BA5]